jgi:hypothetical protein
VVSIQFAVDGTNLGSPVTLHGFKEGATDLTPGGISLSEGRAIFSTSTLGLRSHTITAFHASNASLAAAAMTLTP